MHTSTNVNKQTIQLSEKDCNANSFTVYFLRKLNFLPTFWALVPVAGDSKLLCEKVIEENFEAYKQFR